MIEVKKQAAQGDVLFRRVAALPEDARRVERSGALVVAHSETGHHHTIRDATGVVQYEHTDPLVCYLVAESLYMDVEHERPWDTHAPLRLLCPPGAIWEVRRQREHTPEGWRMVSD